MAFVGTLNVRIGADIRRFRSKMGNARATVGKFRTSIGGLAKSLTGLVPALAGVASIAGIGGLIKGEMAAIDATAKLSAQLGVATEELVKLRHAAELTGAGSKSLDAGLATMAKRLGEAARGSGAATAALKELGLEAKALVMLSPDQAFRQVAAALEEIEEPSRRNAIAANLFSKANMGLLNTLAAGEKGLKAMGDEAERLGLTFTNVDAARVEAANDALTKLGAISTTVFREAAIELGPYITLVGEDLVSAFADAGNAAEDAGKKITDSLAKDTALGKLTNGLEFFRRSMKAGPTGRPKIDLILQQSPLLAGLIKTLNVDPARQQNLLKEFPSERIDRLKQEQQQKIARDKAAEAAQAQAKVSAGNVMAAFRNLVQPSVVPESRFELPVRQDAESRFELPVRQDAAPTGMDIDLSLSQQATDIVTGIFGNAKALAHNLKEPIQKLIEFDQQVRKTIRELNTGLTATFNEGIEFAKTLRTPLEQLGLDLADLDRFLDVGAISEEVHRRGVDAAFEKAGAGDVGDVGDQKDPALQFSAALKRGSAAARSAILQGQAESPEVKVTKESNRLLGDIDRGIRETQKPRIITLAGGPVV